jgi:hypothetical protein
MVAETKRNDEVDDGMQQRQPNLRKHPHQPCAFLASDDSPAP